MRHGQERTSVVHLIDSAGFGGGERYVVDTVRNASSDIRHAVIVPHDGPLKTELERADCPVTVVGMRRRFSARCVLDISRCLRRHNADIVHSHGYRANLHARLAALVSGAKHICTVHVSLYDYLDTPAMVRRAYLIAERASSVVTRRFICISPAMFADMLRAGIRMNKLVQIPNGVDLKRFRPARADDDLRRRLGLSGKGPVIGTVGRMVAEKGQIFLIQAIALLKDSHPEIRCLLIGQGPLLEELKKQAKMLGVFENCVFPGVFEDIERLYPLMDVFVLPSLREPFGLVLLEAMAAATPVVATAAGGPVSFIRSGINGRLVAPKNESALAGAITDLLEAPGNRQRIASAGYRCVNRNFGIQRTVSKIEGVYRAVSGDSKGRKPGEGWK